MHEVYISIKKRRCKMLYSSFEKQKRCFKTRMIDARFGLFYKWFMVIVLLYNGLLKANYMYSWLLWYDRLILHKLSDGLFGDAGFKFCIIKITNDNLDRVLTWKSNHFRLRCLLHFMSCAKYFYFDWQASTSN